MLALVVVALFATPVGGGIASAQSAGGQRMASETYYTLDVPSGSLTARVEAEVQPAGAQLTEIELWAMPGARDINVTRDGKDLSFQVDGAVADLPALVTASLDEPLKGKLTAKLVMTYSVPPGETLLTDLKAGAIETMLVSQGSGSFVLVDVPEDAENVLDPGCVFASKQPDAVRDAGNERWVCGEVLAAAFAGDDDSVRARCAALDDRCRQRSLESPFSAFVQSTTDSSLLLNLDAEVSLAGAMIPLRLRYFRSNADWADRQFGVAQQALPKLEALFGFPYPHDQILLRQSTYLMVGGAAGIAFTDSGEMLLAAGTGIDDDVTVHELAHQWAGLSLGEPWIWEGLAEYALRTVGPEIGLTPYVPDWSSLGYTDPLSTMYNGSSVYDPDYWYGRAGAFWIAYEAAVGGRDNMTMVLAQIDDDPGRYPLDGRWFIDAGEAVSGANLDQLFLDWVWQPAYARPLLAERRAAYDLVNALEAEAAELGLTGIPSDIQANLVEWSFSPVAGQVDRARDVLAEYRDLLAATDAAGLTRTADVAERWATTSIAASDGLVAKHSETVSLVVRAGEGLDGLDADHPAFTEIQEARVAYNDGDLEAAGQHATAAMAEVYNVGASARMIAIATEEQTAFTNGFFKRVGLLWSDPDQDLTVAREAYAQGDYATALGKSRAAFEAWNGARARGLQRLAMMAAVMGGLSLLTWWVLVRMDRGGRLAVSYSGHRLERDGTEGTRSKPSWRDWENTP